MITFFSHEALKTFEECPRQFRFHYLDRIELAKRVPAPVYLGQAVHQTLALLYQMVADGKTPPLDYLTENYLKQWDKPERKDITVDRDYMTVDDYIEMGKRMIGAYYAKHHPFDQSKVILVEQLLTGVLPGTDYRLRGKVDRLSKHPDGTLEICDYKTGGGFPRGGRDPMFYRQMGMYQILVQQNYPNFDKITLAQYYLKPDEIVCHTLSEEELDQLHEEIRVTISLIVRASRSDDWQIKEGGHCNFCNYQELCPAKRHRLILDNEAGKVTGEEKTTAESAQELAEKYIEIYRRLKELEAECEAAKGDVINAAKDLNFSKVSGKSGVVSVSIKKEERFPGKSNDPEGYNKLSQLVRELGLDELLKVDDAALRDAFAKRRFSEEHLKLLSEFAVTKESITVRVTKRKDEDENS